MPAAASRELAPKRLPCKSKAIPARTAQRDGFLPATNRPGSRPWGSQPAGSGPRSPPEPPPLPPQDKSDALSTEELQEELALHSLSGQRELFLLPTSATWASLSTATSVLRVKSLLVSLLSQP